MADIKAPILIKLNQPDDLSQFTWIKLVDNADGTFSVDVGSKAIGAVSDAPITDTGSSASLISAMKGMVTILDQVNVNIGITNAKLAAMDAKLAAGINVRIVV